MAIERVMAIERDESLFAKQQVVRLQALLELGRMIHSTIQLEEVLNTVLAIVVRELELDGAFFTHFPNTYGDVPDTTQTQPGWLSFPLHDKSGVTFTELVVIPPAGRTLTLDEVDFLQSLAIQSSVAIENARFHESTVKWHRIESDLANARQVQRSLLPQEMPHIPGYTVAIKQVTCYAVGGDYLDIVPPHEAGGPTTIVVADVAGKGLASAMVGASFRSAFRAMVNSGIPLLEIATRMNTLHWNEGEESRRRYVTAIFLQLDPATDSIDVINCGHNPAFLVIGCGESEKTTTQHIHASGTPVGMLPFSTYSVEKYSLPRGARLLLYTDGLTEVFRGEEEFGDARLLEAFIRCEAVSSEDVLESLWTALDNFSDGQEQADDMTAMVLLREA